MTSPSTGGEVPGERRAEHVRRDDPSARRASDDERDVRTDGYEYPETALGGADSVQKTSYVVGEGTEPSGAPHADVIARTSSGNGINLGAWIIGLVALAIALVYGFGILR